MAKACSLDLVYILKEKEGEQKRKRVQEVKEKSGCERKKRGERG